MQMGQADLWRMPMWMEMMNTLPASVRVDLKRGSYVVHDNRMRCIYADDLREEEIDQMIAEWALLFEPSYRRLHLPRGYRGTELPDGLSGGGVCHCRCMYLDEEQHGARALAVPVAA